MPSRGARACMSNAVSAEQMTRETLAAYLSALPGYQTGFGPFALLYF